MGKVNLIDLQLSNGFNFLDEKLVVMTEHEIFGKMRKKKARKLNITNAERLKDYNELAVGDFVVHKNHGIGKYLGLQTLEVGGMHRDYLTIQYQNGDTISVPVDHLDLLSKYTAGEGKSPKINKLNDGRWRKTMSSVSKQVEDISDDLIKLYAERQAKKDLHSRRMTPVKKNLILVFHMLKLKTRCVQSMKLSMIWNLNDQWTAC